MILSFSKPRRRAMRSRMRSRSSSAPRLRSKPCGSGWNSCGESLDTLRSFLKQRRRGAVRSCSNVWSIPRGSGLICASSLRSCDMSVTQMIQITTMEESCKRSCHGPVDLRRSRRGAFRSWSRPSLPLRAALDVSWAPWERSWLQRLVRSRLSTTRCCRRYPIYRDASWRHRYLRGRRLRCRLGLPRHFLGVGPSRHLRRSATGPPRWRQRRCRMASLRGFHPHGRPWHPGIFLDTH